MARGGPRPNSGRKPGQKAKLTEQAIARAKREGWQSPLEFMLELMNDPARSESVRADMAKAAAPYCHPRLNAVSVTADKAGSFEIEWHDAADDDTSVA